MSDYPPKLTFVTTPELIEEIQVRHPNMILCYEKPVSGDYESTLVIAGPETTAAGLARALGLCEAVKSQLTIDLFLMSRRPSE